MKFELKPRESILKTFSEHKLNSRAAKPRAILNRDQAVEIFKLKPPASDLKTSKVCLTVASMYKVSEKTVRDIWSGRTWHEETKHLDPSRPVRNSAPPGRPIGRKDSAPRRGNGGHRSSSTIQTCSTDYEDPFHDDWPNWARAGSSSYVILPPVILYTPLKNALSIQTRGKQLVDSAGDTSGIYSSEW
jgi:hypothetical protein